MFSQDLKNETTVFNLLPPASVTADGNGTGVNISGYAGNLLCILNCGAATAGTNPTMDIKIQDSADDSTYADVTGYTFTQVTDTLSLQTLNIDTRLCRKFIRAVKDIGGTSSPAFPLSCICVGYKNRV